MEKSNPKTRNRSQSSKKFRNFPFKILFKNNATFKASDSVRLQVQKAMRERDQANASAMQIRTDFEKLLLQSNQVRKINFYHTLSTFIDLLGCSSTSSSAWIYSKSAQ